MRLRMLIIQHGKQSCSVPLAEVKITLHFMVLHPIPSSKNQKINFVSLDTALLPQLIRCWRLYVLANGLCQGIHQMRRTPTGKLFLFNFNQRNQVVRRNIMQNNSYIISTYTVFQCQDYIFEAEAASPLLFANFSN